MAGLFFNSNPLPMWVYNLETYQFLEVNEAAIKHYGYSIDEFKSMTIKDIRPFDDVDRLVQNVEKVTIGLDEAGVWRHLKKDGTLIYVEIVSHTMEFNGRETELVVAIDVSERVRTQETLRESQARLTSVVDSAMDAIISVDENQRVLLFNPAAEMMFLCAAEDVIGQSFERFIPERYRLAHRKHISDFGKAGKTSRAMGNLGTVFGLRSNGEEFPIEASISYSLSNDQRLFTVILRDTSERKAAEQALKEGEERYRNIFNGVQDAIFVESMDGNILAVNDRACEMYGYTRTEFMTKTVTDLVPEGQPILMASSNKISLSPVETINLRSNGEQFPIEISGRVQIINGDEVLLIIVRDVTERKWVNDALRESEERYRRISEIISDYAYAFRVAEDKTLVNEWIAGGFQRITGFTPEEAAARGGFASLIHPDDSQASLERAERLLRGKPDISEFRIIRKDGEIRWLRDHVHPVWDEAQSRVTYIHGAAEDITERKQAETQVQLQMRRLRGLNEIDRAINSTLDMHVSLDILLGEVISQLGVDAAAVLLLNPSSQILEFVSGKGFRTQSIRQSRLRLGEGTAGQVGLERRVIHIPNLARTEGRFIRSDLLKVDEFKVYFGVPLVAKGMLKGVLEIFHRTPLEPNQEWMNYMEILGGQAAIAIDNAQLFENMEKSNMEIIAAYDATIEGWSRVMDLRDKETEGHTRRVTDLALKLARTMGIGEDELVHLRRGALLHDIGKMGVPDYILLKPDNLNEDEWVIMRQHPQLAYEMLKPISYLRPALDIPASHHEKWDGTGYPHGLKGEQIPLAARIFAVVDVWDALTSDRPYRKAWSREKALAYIREQSGYHFDPTVVNGFMKSIFFNDNS